MKSRLASCGRCVATCSNIGLRAPDQKNGRRARNSDLQGTHPHSTQCMSPAVLCTTMLRYRTPMQSTEQEPSLSGTRLLGVHKCHPNIRRRISLAATNQDPSGRIPKSQKKRETDTPVDNDQSKTSQFCSYYIALARRGCWGGTAPRPTSPRHLFVGGSASGRRSTF